jgi:hypothetical protein
MASGASMVQAYLAERGQLHGRQREFWPSARCETGVYVVMLVVVLSVLLILYSPFTARLNIILLSLISAPPLLAFVLELSINERTPANREHIDESNSIACKSCCALDGVFVLIFILLLQVLVLNFSPADTKLNVIAVCLLLIPPGCAFMLKLNCVPPSAVACLTCSQPKGTGATYLEIPELSLDGCSEELIRSYNEDL